jgi:hypothetical protein
MVDLAAERAMIQEEETRFKAAVSEAVMQKFGKLGNFINTRQYDTKAFFLNGRYGQSTVPLHGIDGAYIFPFDATIFNVYIFNLVAGSSGTTELDVKRVTASGGAGSTIFSTTPKIAATAGANAYVGVGGSGVGLTAPIFTGASTTTFDVDADDMIYVSMIQKQAGNPENSGLLVCFRPR